MAEFRVSFPYASGVPALIRRAIDADTDGLRALLLSMIRANSAAPGALIAVSPTPDGTWAPPVRPAGARFMWIVEDGVPFPTTADGILDGDIVSGAASGTVNVPAWAVPVAVDRTGTTTDAVRLTKTDGVTWTIAGDDYPSAGMTQPQVDVPWTGGTAATVRAKPSSPTTVLTGTTTWTLPFTDGTVTEDVVVTSDTFNVADTAVPAGRYVTDGAVGGNPRAITATKSGLTIKGGKLVFGGDAGLRSDVAEPSLAIEFVIGALAPAAPAYIACANSATGKDSVRAYIRGGGVLMSVARDWNEAVRTERPAKAGDTVRISFRGTDAWMTVNGVETDRVTGVNITPSYWSMQGAVASTTTASIDSFKVIRLA